MKEVKEPFEVIKSRHYANVFSGESGEFVLQDLMKFCGVLSDGFDPTPGVTDYNSGKRGAFCYIVERLQLNEMQVYSKLKLDSVINEEFKKSAEFSSMSSDDVSEYSKATFAE